MTTWEFFYHCIHPSRHDLITACFDLIFVSFGISNIRCLIRDKMVKGFDWKNMCLFVLWNLWSITVIYPEAKMYLANVINVIYLSSQITWLVLYFKYKKLA